MKTHYKKLTDTNYFGSWDIEQSEIILRITKVERQEVMNGEGRADNKIVLHLDKYKPLILNKTNEKSISKLFGPYVEDWVNKYFTAFKTNVKSFGETVEAVRIRTRPPVFNDKHPAYADAVKAVKEGKRTKEQIKAAFNASDAVIDKL